MRRGFKRAHDGGLVAEESFQARSTQDILAAHEVVMRAGDMAADLIRTNLEPRAGPFTCDVIAAGGPDQREEVVRLANVALNHSLQHHPAPHTTFLKFPPSTRRRSVGLCLRAIL